MKLLIDTDIGDDIDDTLALLTAMDKGADIVGITTVLGNTAARAEMVRRMLTLYGRGYEKVPVIAGMGSRDADVPPLYEGESTACNTDGEEAVEFIIEQCRRWGEELTLLAIGPFTNLAEAARRAPEEVRRARTVIMGGSYFNQYVDWNVCCDPCSAAEIFNTLPGLYCIGADVTHKLRLYDREEKIAISYSGKSEIRRHVSHQFRRFKELEPDRRTALHDPLAVIFALESEVCTTTDAPVAVVTEGVARGLTLNLNEYGKARYNPYFTEHTPAVHHLASTVNVSRMMGEFYALFDK